MKILTLHSDYIKFEPTKKAIKTAEEIEMNPKEMKECLVVFTAVEKEDENNLEGIVNKLIEEIKKVAEQVKTKNIVLYPYAHLSSNLSKPDFAIQALKEAEKKLSKEYKVMRAPFGWYKKFEVSCKGHPLSELSRQFTNEAKKENKEEPCDPKKLLKEITKIKLDTTNLKENDHRILGQKLDLFSFNEVAPGMVFWHNNGLIIFNELVKYWREEKTLGGYQEISTPQIMDKRLWQISGHWDKYKENNFVTKYEDTPMLVKPMSCPGGMLVYKNKPKSYKELPLRVAELGKVHRVELSGTLGGLFRLIQFTQDDAHVFCTEEQIEKEISNIIDMIFKMYKKLNIEFDHVELSTRPEKRVGSDKVWDKAEGILEGLLKKKKINHKINPGDGAFYGPKIDFKTKDSLGRTWQTSTIQLDFNMPERFELEYTGEDNKNKMPAMLHYVVYGAVERFIGIYLEHTNGNLPVWLSPVQAIVIPITEKNNKTAREIQTIIKEQKIRTELDESNETMEYKIRKAQLQKIPYMIIIGDKEEKNKTISVRNREGKNEIMKTEEFITIINKKIKERDNKL